MSVKQSTIVGYYPPAHSQYSDKEERLNALTHGLGVVLGVFALVAMLLKPADLNSIQIAGIITYGLSLICLFLASTLYHSSKSELWQKRFKMADHCAIYTLIAGTYTPLMLIALSSESGYWVLLAIWLLTAGGIVFKTLFIGRFKAFSVTLYLIMGWLCLLVMGQLYNALSVPEFSLLLLGGMLYSLGVIFYVNKRIPYNHAIWHLFVLAGAYSQFACIYLII
ncbi:hemolysin III family protein [Shewanella maritima]|uniref:Hemolysin III family protein n=1 Tax=Shewanella maritima TaxID=2520507 RepID=A0A411PMF8_9GAMM|nr:hemolysin III family protein [Shewanella maritima]QBF84695.1 hemolysin III family protein [Shewanella maritima]